MDRKKFIRGASVTGLGAVAVAAAASAAAAAPTDAQMDAFSNRNIQFMVRIIQAVIDDLNQDQRGYGGHRSTAVDKLSGANAELQAALQYVHTHGQ